MSSNRPRKPQEKATVDDVVIQLRERINAGDFRKPDGSPDKLPSAQVLGDEYGLSRQSLVRVLEKLKAEGIVRTRKGSGAWVHDWKPLLFYPQSEFHGQAPNIDIYTSLLDAAHRKGDARMDEITREPADELIRSRLDLLDGEYVAVRRRTNMVDGAAAHTDDSYVALRIVERSDWVLQDNVERGTNRVLAELGHEIVRSIDEIHPHTTTEGENLRLGLGAGNSVPAIKIVSTNYDAADVPVQVTLFTLPAHRNITVYERFRNTERGGE
ncbi:GntR family transcriptional regulator [Streptomyces sp. NPDC048638]|uniref:GntR family transcriptional regulator n=1 Tax=Streptomyces sp. NPDC048638 TaxID=3365580 RepID=UPI003723557A